MLLMGHGFCADWSPTLQIVLKKVSFNDLNRLRDTAQWRSQNAEKVTHIKGRLLDQAVILLIASLFIMGTSHIGKNLLPKGANSFLSFGMENHFYHIR